MATEVMVRKRCEHPDEPVEFQIEKEDGTFDVEKLQEMHGRKKRVTMTDIQREALGNEIRRLRGIPIIGEKEELPFHDFAIDFQSVNLAGKHVNQTGFKSMFFEAMFNGKKILFRHAAKPDDFNYGRDAMVLDRCKPVVGLMSVGMMRIKTNQMPVKINTKQRTWDNNWKFVESKQPVVYLIMDYLDSGENESDVFEPLTNKHFEPTSARYQTTINEFLMIGLYRGIFRVTDFSVKNCFIHRESGKIVSLNENCIGMRISVIGQKIVLATRYHISKEDVNTALEHFITFNDQLKEKIIQEMKIFDFNQGMIDRVLLHLSTLKQDLIDEACI